MAIRKLLLNWYETEGRELPWRETNNPYRIWISEVILQQTRIQQGMEYFRRFMERFPDISSLAKADIMDVLKTWQGLGYYSRARNLHEAARVIEKEYNGKFPGNYEEIKKLKGIGEYTAGAIASIAFGEVVPAIDGNVKRVITRITGSYDDPGKSEGLQKIREFIVHEIDPEQPGNFNQALMDLGSVICTPVKPSCSLCPLSGSCEAYRRGIVNELPVRNKTRETRIRYFYYLVFSKNDEILIRQRDRADIWKLLFDFPLIESEVKKTGPELYQQIAAMLSLQHDALKITRESGEIIHILSHQKIHASFIHLEVENFPACLAGNCIAIRKEDISNFPLPRLVDRYLENHSL